MSKLLNVEIVRKVVRKLWLNLCVCVCKEGTAVNHSNLGMTPMTNIQVITGRNLPYKTISRTKRLYQKYVSASLHSWRWVLPHEECLSKFDLHHSWVWQCHSLNLSYLTCNFFESSLQAWSSILFSGVFFSFRIPGCFAFPSGCESKSRIEKTSQIKA